MRPTLRLAFACVAGAVLALPAAAQEDYSADQIRELFERQRALFNEAEESGLGQTRGLKLVTIEDVEAGSEEAAAAEDGAAGGGSVSVSDPNRPLTYGQLDEDLQINLRIEFGFDSAALSESEEPKLQAMCDALRTSSVELVQIVGHTDSAGSDEYNERLSVLRAEEVARYLTEECGIAPARLKPMGLGERFPLNENEPRADENRRVEFQALS